MSKPQTQPMPDQDTPIGVSVTIGPAPSASTLAADQPRFARFRANCRLVWPLYRSGYYARRLMAQLIDAYILFSLAFLFLSGTPFSPVVMRHGERTVTPFAEIPLLNRFWFSWGPIDTTTTAGSDISAPPVTLFRYHLPTGTQITWDIHPQRRWPVALLIFVAYHAGLVAAYGRTMGKQLMGLRVVASDGERVDLAQALLRPEAYLLAALSHVGVGWILLDRQRRGWHDLAVGTRVVET